MSAKTIWVMSVLSTGAAVFGAGFQLYTEGSAEALGQAGAISGRTHLTSQAWYNPAALAGTDTARVMAGNTLALIDTEFNSSLNPAWDSDMEEHWRSIPHVYYVQPFRDRLTGTLSVNAPYGLITEWPDRWAGNFVATRTELSAAYITPSLAWQVTEEVSFSAGFNLVRADADLQAGRNLSVITNTLPDLGIRKLTGDDIGYGYTASAHWQIHDDWGLGARYQSRVDLKLEGDVEYENNPGPGDHFDMTGKVTLPSSVNVGVANSSFEKVHLGLDVVWSEWSTYDSLVCLFPTNPYESSPEAISKRWKDVWSIRLGGEYDLNENWVVRGGYVWDESPVEGDTRAPELPGSDRQMLMTGLGWKDGGFGIDLAYSYLWAEKGSTGAEVAGKAPATAGNYKTTTHLVSLSASYEF